MPREKADRLPFTFRLDEIAYAKAKIIARNEERVVNSQLEYWIKRGIEQYEKEHGEVVLCQDQ